MDATVEPEIGEGEVMKLLVLLSAGILLLLGFTGSGALAAPKEKCTGPISRTHGSVTVTGTCAVTGPLTIDGDLTLADGAVFVGFGPAIHVTGNVKVGKGAQLALGYNRPEGVLGPDTVDGNIVANQPLAVYLGNSTVHGNFVSNGGGTSDRFYNFPIKDNVIDGNLIIHGWTGGWWGAIANTVGGNVDVSNNRAWFTRLGRAQEPSRSGALPLLVRTSTRARCKAEDRATPSASRAT